MNTATVHLYTTPVQYSCTVHLYTTPVHYTCTAHLCVLCCRGLYLTTIFYRDDNVLVTPDDQIPVVEVEDACSSSLMQDFLWFTKVRQTHRQADEQTTH